MHEQDFDAHFGYSRSNTEMLGNSQPEVPYNGVPYI